MRSLALLAVVIAIALVGLGLDGNWPKMLRVGLAAAAYAATLLVLARRPASVGNARAWMFGVAGAIAGVSSGLLRPDVATRPIVIDVLAAMVLSAVHWLWVARGPWVRRTLFAR